MKIWTIEKNFPRAAIKPIMQMKRIAASVEKIIFALFVIPIIGEIKRDRRGLRELLLDTRDTCFGNLLA